MKYRLIAVNADGHGIDYLWGDSYEVEAKNYVAARADVLSRAGADGKPAYARILKAWRWSDLRKSWVMVAHR